MTQNIISKTTKTNTRVDHARLKLSNIISETRLSMPGAQFTTVCKENLQKSRGKNPTYENPKKRSLQKQQEEDNHN